MYKIKNGILFEGQRPVFGLGLSYYPSYHEKKVPVPESGDRMGEMKKDLRRMKKEGFNLVRVASIGDVRRVDGEIEIHTEFIDALLKEAEGIDLAAMVRLQGYSMNLSGHDDFYMLDQAGKELDRSRWYDFIQNSLYHQGILKDNAEGTRALAEHYAKWTQNVVAFQTYNEPHYPFYAIFDYHPATVQAYRQWLVKKGVMNEEAAATYDPPRRRPQKEESPEEWIRWRLFAFESLANFLNQTASVAKAVSPEKQSLTCIDKSPGLPRNIYSGCCYFDNAKGMDIVGMTTYINPCGALYYLAGFLLDNAESAAALYGKHAWLVEYDARTDISLKKFYEQTYMAVGAGFKGIMYYQWRGDHIFPDSPEGNGFGFLNYDGTPTKGYDEKMAMIRLLNRLSPWIVGAEKKRCRAAILHSKYAFCYADALENGAEAQNNSVLHKGQVIYQELRREGITVDFVEAENLKENPLNIAALYVPSYEFLSDREKQWVHDFAEQGNRVYCYEEALQYRELKAAEENRWEPIRYTIGDTLKINGIHPIIRSANPDVMVQVLEGNGYYLASLNNISAVAKEHSNVDLDLQELCATEATWFTPDGERKPEIRNGTVCIPAIREGGFLLLTKKENVE